MSEGTRVDSNSLRTNARMRRKREKGSDRLCGFLHRGARINQSTRPAKSKPVRGSHDNPGVKTLGKAGKRSTVRNPERELEDLTLKGTSIVSSRTGATGPDSNPPSGPGEQEKPTLGLRLRRSDCPHHERSKRDTSVKVAARNLNVTEAIARETNSQGDKVARHPRHLNRGGSTRRRRHNLDRETHPEASTSGSHHTNQEENKPTLRKQGPASRDLGSRNRKTKRFSISMLSEE